MTTRFKHLTVTTLLLILSSLTLYGQNNTPLTAKYARKVALEASTGIEGALYNPAGLAKLNDGIHLSFSSNILHSKRTITATNPLYELSANKDVNKSFVGKSTFVLPTIQGAYKTEKWVFSLSFSVTGEKANYKNGLSIYEDVFASVPTLIATNFPFIQTGEYRISQHVEQSSYKYGLQLGATYQFNEKFAVFGGVKLSHISNLYTAGFQNLETEMLTTDNKPSAFPSYDGSMQSPNYPITLMLNNLQQITNPDEIALKTIKNISFLEKASANGALLDSRQSGTCITPIVGFNFNYEKLNIGMKYKFRTSLDAKNKTKQDDIGMFTDGEKTSYDLPAFLSIGASYQILPQLQASIGYHRIFNEREMYKYLKGTNEFLLGIEYQINKTFLISAGGQLTQYEGKDKFYQADLNHTLDSYSIGFGGAVNLNDKIQLNAGYMLTRYSDYEKTDIESQRSYARKGGIFSMGIDVSF